MRYDTVVWDFNGTLFDDVDIGIDCVNAMLARRNMKTLPDRESYFAVFGFPIEDYYRRVGFDFDKEPYTVLAHEWIAEYRSREKTVPLRLGVIDCLRAFRDAGLRQVVLSATESKMLREQLTDLGILSFFDEILGRGDIYAADKTALAVAWAKETNPGNTVMIGDTEHDLACALKAGFTPLLVRGGHTSDTVIGTYGCPVADNINEVRKMILNGTI